MSQHPEIERRLHEELDEVLGGGPPTLADVPRLAYTDRVLREALRLYPPAYAFARESLVDSEIGGYTIPAKSTVVMSQWVLHRDPRFYDRPEEFDPDRWAGVLAKRLPRFAYLPFGGGPHLCIGASFATLEATLALAAIARRFHVTLAPGHRVAAEPLLTLRPLGGMPMVLTTRRASRSPAPALPAPRPQRAG